MEPTNLTPAAPAPAGTPTPLTSTPVSPGLPPQMPNTAKPAGSKKMIVMLLVIFLVVAILITGGFLLYNMVSNNNPDLQPPDATQGSLNELNSQVQNTEIQNPDAAITQLDQQISTIDATNSSASSGVFTIEP